MNCEEARQSAPAYALGVLTEEEQAEFERHIAECDADHGLTSLTRTAERLAETAPEMDPPAGLRARIMTAAAAEGRAQAVSHDAPPVAAAPPPAPYPTYSTPSPGASGSALRVGRAAYALAASAVIVITALVAWNLVLQMDDSEEPVHLRHFYSEDDGDWLRVETGLGEPGLTLAVGGLDTLGDEDRYQFWAIRGSDWLHIGDFNTNPEGRWAGDFDFALEEGDSIVITSGPLADNGWPANDPEIQTRI